MGAEEHKHLKQTTAFENHAYLNSIEQIPEFQSDDVMVFAHI